MKSIGLFFVVSVFPLFLVSCGSGGSSDGAGGNKGADECVSRSGDTVYVNDCDFPINAIVIEPASKAFRIEANDSVTRPASTFRFGACRAPSAPVLNDDNKSIFCS